MEYHVNKSKDDFRCFSTTKVVIESLKQHKNNYERNIDNFSYTQNSKLRNNRNNCNNICMNGLIFKREEGINVCEGQLSMAGSSLCKNLSKLNNHLIIKTISDPCQSFLASSNDFKTAREMFDSFTCLRSTADRNNGKKANTFPCHHSGNTVFCENFSICQNKNKVKQFMDMGKNKKLLHKIYMTTFFPVFKTSSHKNVFYEMKPDLDILLKPTTMCNYKKNNYFKEFRNRICFPRDQVDSAYKLYTFVSPSETRKRAKREKVTNTSITCFVKIPPKSYKKTKKITFMPKRKMVEKSRSSCCDPRIINLYTNSKKDSKMTPCEKRLFIEKLNKFIALNTLLEEKSPEEKHEIVKCLAQNGVALPTATTLYEKKIMNKIQKELAVSNKSDKLQSGNRAKSLKINFLRSSRDKAQTNSSSTKKHLISEKNCARGELCISNDNLNDEKITEIFPPPAKRHKEIKEHIGLEGKPKLRKMQTDKCDLHRTCSKKEKRAWNLRKNCRGTKKSFLVGLTVQNDQGRKSSFLKRIKHCKLFNKKNCVLKIELYPYYFSNENHNNRGLFTHNNNNVKTTIGKPTVQSQCELKDLKNLVDESRISKLNRLWKINNQILFMYEKSRQIHYQLYENILEKSKRNIRHKDNINVFNPSIIDEQKSSKDMIRKHSILSLRDVRTIESSLPPNIRTTNSKIKQNLLRKCSPFHIPPKYAVDYNCSNLIEGKYFEEVSTLRRKKQICSSPLKRSHKFVTSRSLPCMENEFNEKFHYKNLNKTEEKYLSTTISVVAVDVIKSKDLNVLYCNDCTTLKHSQRSITFYGHSNKVQNLKCFKVNNNKHSTYKATSLHECTNAKINMDTYFQVKNINSKMTSIVPGNTSSVNCFYLLEKITGAQKNVFSQYATEKHIRFKCPEEITFHKNKRWSQSSLPHSRRKHTCCIKNNDGSSEFFRYPEHKSSTSINNMQKKKNMSLKSKRIQTQLSLLQTKSSFVLKDAQNQAKLLEPQNECCQYRPKKYMLKKRSGGECDKGRKSSSDICKTLRRNLYPPDAKLKRNTSSLSTHNSKFMIKEAPSPKRILIKGRNRRKWRGMSCESLGDVKKCWCKIFEKYKWRLKEIYSPTYCRPLAYTENLNGATRDLLEDKNDLQLENKEYKLTFSDFKGLTEEQLKNIIKQLKQCVPNSNEIPSNSSFGDNMTSEEEMMFYCDYAAALNNDILSKLNSDGSIFSMDDDEKDSVPQGIKLHIRPNSRTLNRKWWSFFIKDL